ncbi:MAG TPA: Ig-like domain-containing protein, partial [Longimicrobium sp.]
MLLRRTAALLLAALSIASCDNPAGPGPDPVATPTVPAKLDVVSGGDQQATVGQELAQPLVVRLLDDRGRPVRNHIVNFRVIAGGGTVFAGSALTNNDGEARERWTLGTAARDTQRVEARAVDPATGQPLVFGTFKAVGTADAPANIAPVGPPALTASPGSTVPVAVRVEDRFGNRVAGAVIAWQLPEGQGTVTPTQAGTDSTGVAAAQWTLAYSVGAHTMTAFAGVSLSTQFTAAAETPEGSRLAVVSGDGQVVAAGSGLAQPLVVRLQNAAGQPIRNAAVAWSVSAGSITPAATVTDAQGQVSASWTPGTGVGVPTATASAAGAASTVFRAHVGPGAAAELRKVSGDGQTAFTGGELPEGARVAVVDAYGNPVAGREVRWRIVSGGGSVSSAASLTGVDGRTETRWTLGATAGQQALAAEAGSLSVQFLAMASVTPPPPPPIPSVEIVSPVDGSRVGDSFVITVKVRSPEAVAGVNVSVEDRTYPLTFSGDVWSGTINAAGLPAGSLAVTAWASSARSQIGTASATYIHDAPAPGPVRILSPTDGSRVGDSFRISVSATSSEEVTGVTAAVAGRSFPLAFSDGAWSGNVSFAGLSGSQTVTVTARTASGVAGTASATYIKDAPPLVGVELPVLFQVASPSIRVKATCSDDGAAGCASLSVLVGTSTVLAQGTSSVDATVSLAAYNGQQVTLRFVGRDAAGQTSTATRDVYVETSAAWSNPEHGPGLLLDVDAGRLLAAGAGKLEVRSRSTGAVQTIFYEAGTEFPKGFLTPRGAIFIEGPSTLNRRVRDWRDGAVVTFPATFVTMLKVAGDYALWHQNNNSLIRRDLQAGTNVVVSTNAGNVDNDVAANGDVVFTSSGTYDVFRYRAGVAAALTSTADPFWNVHPLTDGSTVVFRKQDPCCAGNFRVMMIGAAGGEVPLSDPNGEQIDPGSGYQVAGGWIAFTR